MGLSIIFVNYHTEDFIYRAVSSLYQYLTDFKFEVIVVNNSIKSDLQKLNTFNDYTNFKIINNTGNYGFSSGCNLGAMNSNYEYFLFLNPDVELVDDSIKKLYDYHLKNNDIGISSGLMMYRDTTLQYCFNYFPNISWELYHLIATGYNQKIKKLLSRKEIALGETFEVDWFHGAFFMISKKDFFNVEGFNEKYFMYYEDVEICFKVKKKLKKKNVCVPYVRILHEERSSVKENTNDDIYYFHINRSKLLFLRNYSKLKAFSMRTVSLIAIVLRIISLPFWKKHKGHAQNKLKQLLKILRLYVSKNAVNNTKFEFISNA
ncbi:MAG: glycosyltransferase [Bacteroidetes bacterium]|nr:glycosyltransferase [Bacteroidota bacterium]